MAILGIFKTKSEREWDNNYQVKQRLRDAERRITVLEDTIKKHASHAKRAIKEGLPDMVELARFAMKKAVQDRQMTIRWKINLEIFNDLKDSTEANKAFLKSIKVLASQMNAATNIDAQKVFQKFKMESDKANQMMKDIQDQLQDQEQAIKNEDFSSVNVTDKEIDALIYGPDSDQTNLVLEGSTPNLPESKPEKVSKPNPDINEIEQKLNEFKKKLDKK
jgi:hypothetical protein